MTRAVQVVIVEDDNGHATLVRRHLKRAGMGGDPVHVRDGQEALDYLYRRRRWAGRVSHSGMAVVVDLNMPRVNGLEFLRRLKSDQDFTRIPVFILTTTDNPAELDRCYSAGASACIVKPVDGLAFADAIQHLARFLMTVHLPSEPDAGRAS